MDFKTIIQEKLKNINIKLNEDLIPGGKGDNKTPEDIAKKHGVSVEDIKKEIELGIKTEIEHSGDEKKQREIATDHVSEHPKYYSDKKHGLNVQEPKLNENVTPAQMKSQKDKVIKTGVDAATEKAKQAQLDAQAAKEEATRLKSSQNQAKPTNLVEDGAPEMSTDKPIEPPKEELTNTGVTPEQETKIKEFLTTNQGLDDTKFHAFVQSMGIDPHEAEEMVYKIVYDLAQIINGGTTPVETETIPPVSVEEPETVEQTSNDDTLTESVSRMSKTKMDLLKEAWQKVKK